MNENLNTINKILTATCQKIEQECGLKNSTFILSLLLNYIDTNTWKFDRGLFAKIYQMLEIIENDNDLRAVFGTIQEVNNNEKEIYIIDINGFMPCNNGRLDRKVTKGRG